MILALLVFKLQLTSHPDGGHFWCCARLGTQQTCKPYGIVDIWTTLGAFGRIWTIQSLYCANTPD